MSRIGARTQEISDRIRRFDQNSDNQTSSSIVDETDQSDVTH